MKSKQQGNIGIGKAIAYFTQMCCTVSIPLNDAQDYDIVVDIDNALRKVQVKTSRCLDNRGSFRVSLKSDSTYTYKEFDKNSVDYVFIYTIDGKCYLIPSDKITQKTGISVGGKNNLYGEFLV